MTATNDTAEARMWLGHAQPHQQSLVLDLPINPVPLGRPRVTNGRTYTPPRSAEFQEAFRWRLLEAGVRRPITEPLVLTLTFWRHHTGNNRGDLSNLIKAVEDAGNGFLWTDDRLIVELHARLADAGSQVVGRVLLRATYPQPLNPIPED